MPTEDQNSAVLDDLIQEMGAGDIAISEAIKLSPPLVLTACLLYIMASDGKIQEQESSQLQQVIGGNDGLLAHALAYVKAFPVEKFLEDAPSVLSQKDKLCIMANLYDSMLADGNADKREHEIFNKFREAFDLKKSDISLIVEVVTLKNNKDIFGEFKLTTSDNLSDLTPHLAMAVSIVYMMSADGSIGQEEIGQLEAMVGEFEGLQEFALQLVRKIKRGDFLSQAKHALDKPQRLCVLLNVCDSMMSDETIGMLEDKLFVTMLDAFAVKESAFKKYYEVLELKNIKPFDVSDFEYSIEHVRTLSQQEQKGIVVEGTDDQFEVGVASQRTMEINTERVTNDFGSNDNIQQVQDNATHELENQRSLDIKVDPNLQEVLSGSDDDENIQAIGGASNSTVLKVAPTEDRVENLQKVVDELSTKLNKFEAKNKSLLNNILANTNKETSKDLAFDNRTSETNKAKVANEATKDNLQSVNAGSSAANKALVAKDGVKDNLQSAAEKAKETNKAVVAKEAIKDNNQAIASSANGANKAGVTKEAIEDNLQSAAEKANEANNAAVAKEVIKDNKAAVAKEAIKDNNQAIASNGLIANKTGVAKEALDDNLQSIPVKPANTNDARVAKAGFTTNRQPIGNTSRLSQTSGATRPLESSPINSTDALGINSEEAFASQTETELENSVAQHQVNKNTETEAPIVFKKQQSPISKIFGKQKPSKFSFKFYARVLATFFVMALWTSNIAATRLDMGSMVFGHLMRISPDQLDLR